MIVVDASVAAKWFLLEDQTALAPTLLMQREHELCGPDLLRVEVCRAIVAAANARRVTSDQAKAALNRWLDRTDSTGLPLHLSGGEALRVAADLATHFGHPLKDCIYLALADRLGCVVVTADARFRDRVADPARVKLLTELA